MNVSVIVATYNRPFSLLLSGLSLARQDRLPEEIIIADDGSGAETFEVVRRLQEEMPCPVRHAWQEDLGWRSAAARNNGIRASSGEYLIFIDGDVLVDKGFVAAHVAGASKGTFLIGNALRLDEESSGKVTEEEVRSGAFFEAFLPQAKRRLSKVHKRNQGHILLRRLHLCKRHKPKLIGLNFSLYRSDIDRINGFDEDFVGWGQEDDDLGLRLMLAGIRPKSVAAFAIAFHLYHASSASQVWSEGGNSQRLLRKDLAVFCEKGLVRR